MFNHTLEEINRSELVYFELEARLEALAEEFGMTCVNKKCYALESYSFNFMENEDGNSLTNICVSNIEDNEDTINFPFPTTWIWDEPGTHKNAYFEWIEKCPKIMYRPYKNTYQESMSNIKWFHTEEEMFEYIANNNKLITNISSLFIGDDIIYDKRNTWNTRHVMCSSFAGIELENPVCVGVFNFNPIKRRL